EAGTSFDPFDIDPEDPFDVGSWHYGVDADNDSLMLAPGTMELMLMMTLPMPTSLLYSVPESSDSGEESEIFPIQEIDMEKLSTATKTVPEAREESDHDVCPLPKVVTSNVQNTTTEKKKPKRPCYYCGEEQSQLVRHLTRKHKMEDAVVAALKLPKMEQRRAFEKIRKDGILKMNVDRFSAVLDLNLDYIFYTAQVMCEQIRNTLRKPQAMPVEEDVSKLRAFILNEMQKL
ncbi:hypothetical protein RRG08_026590, partial [Elysia crispata]